MEKQKPLNELYVIDWKNSGSVVRANWYQTKTPTGGGKVSVRLSSPEPRSHNTPLRHGRLVWNIPVSSQPPSRLTWMSALTSEMGRPRSHLCHSPTLPHPCTHILARTMNACFWQLALCVSPKSLRFVYVVETHSSSIWHAHVWLQRQQTPQKQQRGPMNLKNSRLESLLLL